MVIRGPERNLPKKITGNLDRNHGPNSGQLAAICLTVKLRGFTVKQLVSLQTKINLSSAKGGRLVLRPRWTQHAILPLIYHCVITHDALAQGPGLVKSLADKIFILPYSQTQSSEIPFLLIITQKLLLILHFRQLSLILYVFVKY